MISQRQCFVFAVLGSTLALVVAAAGQNPPQDEVDLGAIFDPSDSNAGYQRRYTIDVLPKAEDCFYLQNVRENQVLNYHFMVKRKRNKFQV